MGGKRQTHTIDIQATRQRCYEVIREFESYPAWQPSIKHVSVIARDDAGRPRDIGLELDAIVRSVRYTLRYEYDDEATILRWKSIAGDMKQVDGIYIFEDKGEGRTLATYSLLVDPGMWVPGPIWNTLSGPTMKQSMAQLKQRAEAAPTSGRSSDESA